MTEPRTFASLSPSLLARKGSARPAMRRQDTASFGMAGMRADPGKMDDLGWNDWGDVEQQAPVSAVPEAPMPEPVAAPVAVHIEEAQFDEAPVAEAFHAEPHLDEDSGEDGSTGQPMASLTPEMPGIAPRKPDVLRQIEDLAERINRTAAPVRTMVPEGRRAAFTLRLDAERHFRLKMAGLLTNRSAQVIVTEALDKYLAEFADISSPALSAGKHS
ncbi:hypothetical protein [Novosphingobium sp. PhB165]|uniref:hypothetical protein n=1 Tax=Novosphingobium sp. PhB165 TaxID=2485105 RepID=UPI001043C869|nr:hypothetical protein [Novosphingobium sp. PhB165]